jgi:hypothetical protein
VRSRIATAVYTFNGVPAASVAQKDSTSPAAITSATGSTKFLLAQGTAVPLIFGTDVSSRTAGTGEKISLTLAEDLKAGDVVLAKKGTTSLVTVTKVDKPRMGGQPGELYFEATSLQIGDAVIKLRGVAAKEGQGREGKSAGLMVVPVVPAGLFVHGKNAEVKQGTVFTAFVAADNMLPPAN